MQDVFYETEDRGGYNEKILVHPQRYFTYEFDKVYPVQAL